MDNDPKVEAYFIGAKKWQDEMLELRSIVRKCKLNEEFKWRVPCYTWEGKNIAMISALKDYCALSFPKGTLLKDPQNILVQPGENSRSARLIKFTDLKAIKSLVRTLRSYIEEAIELENLA
ncbi:MAG: DUF1801 domain-containing protein [Pirellulaceae bacterium]